MKPGRAKKMTHMDRRSTLSLGFAATAAFVAVGSAAAQNQPPPGCQSANMGHMLKPQKQFWQLLMLTGVRLTELLEASWDEFDLEGATGPGQFGKFQRRA